MLIHAMRRQSGTTFRSKEADASRRNTLAIRPRQPERVTEVPWFIAAGELDFGRSGASSLSKALHQKGAKQVFFKEYPNVEHMVIVQAALPDAFAFFDQCVIKLPNTAAGIPD